MSNQTALLVDAQQIITWLENRRKVSKDWYESLKAAEASFEVLIGSYKEDFKAYPPIVEHIELFMKDSTLIPLAALNELVAIILSTNLAQARSLITRNYSDKRVNAWVSLQSYILKKQLQGVVLGKYIDQMLVFEIPAADKAVQSTDAQLALLKRKIDSNINTIYEQRQRIVKQRINLGLQEDKNASRSSLQDQIPLLIAKVPLTIEGYHTLLSDPQMELVLKVHSNLCGQVPEIEALNLFVRKGDILEQVYEAKSQETEVDRSEKYQSFSQWKAASLWGLGSQGHATKTTIIQTGKFRQKLLISLNYLQYFVKGLLSQTAAIASLSPTITPNQLSSVLHKLEGAISFLTSPKLLKPLELKVSSKAYEGLLGEFQSHFGNIMRLQDQNEAYTTQIKDLQKARVSEVEKLAQMKQKVVSHKKLTEVFLSEVAKRQVRLTGKINTFE